MFAVIIHEKGGQPRRQSFAKTEVTIGRVQGNDIVLPKQNVSKRHSRIVLKDGKFIIVDLKSTNGTYVNGRKIASPMVIKSSDKIYIGDFIISVEGAEGESLEAPAMPKSAMPPPAPVWNAAPSTPPAAISMTPPIPAASQMPKPPAAPFAHVSPLPPPAPAMPPAVPASPAIPAISPASSMPSSPMPASTPAAPAIPAAASTHSSTPALTFPGSAAEPSSAPPAAVAPHPIPRPQSLPAPAPRRPAPRPLAATPTPIPGLHSEPPQAIAPVVAPIPEIAPVAVAPAPAVVKEAPALTALNAATADAPKDLGIIAPWLEESDVRRIVVNRADSVFIDRGQGLQRQDQHFADSSTILAALRALLDRAGLELNPSDAFIDAWLPNGAHLYAGLACVGGPFFEVEKPSDASPTLEEMVTQGSMSQAMATFLTWAMQAGRKIIVSGNDLDSRLTLIRALLAKTPDARVIAIEGGGRLDMNQAGILCLTSSSITDRSQLVRNALKLRPDRLVIADSCGPEAYDALCAFGGGVNGGIIGIDAESPEDALIRFVRQAALNGAKEEALNALLRENFDILVQVLRYANNSLCVTTIQDIDGQTTEVFSGLGGFRPTGHVPRWITNAQSLGQPFDTSIFQ